MTKKLEYSLQPLVMDAADAHAQKYVEYKADGTAVVSHPALSTKYEVPLSKQYSAVMATFMDLNKSLSRLANSPKVEGGSLREKFDAQFAKYRELVTQAQQQEKWEPDFGSYVFDHTTGNLYLVAPEYWHRLGLVTNTAKLMTDVTGQKTWQEIRQVFDNAVVGILGVSVGGNVLEGVMREVRPKTVKIADPDWQEITNLNRLERGSIRHMVASKASRQDPKNHFELNRVNKTELAAYEHQLVDPYSKFFLYPDGVDSENLEQFLMGDGKDEPKIDLMIEEMDNFSLKYEVRKICRKHKIPVLMMSDFGHRVQVQYQDFRNNPELPLGHQISDEELEKVLNTAMTSGGNREAIFKFVEALCGPGFAADEFADWVKGEGEQPTSSLPQSGATALGAGAIGGKMVGWSLLGYKIPEWQVFDLKNSEVLK